MCGLTQAQLGMRVGLRGRAVYRWERGASVPSRRSRRALVTVLNALNPAAASMLAEALAVDGRSAAAAPVPVPIAPPPISEKQATELAVFAMADELDLSARRVRGSLARLLRRMRETNLTLDAAQRELHAWMGSSE
jgi:transcriptional regulator with XRE-family HTH domain